MTYRAPVADIAFTLKHAAGLKGALDEGLYGDLTEDVVDAVLEEAGKFATDVIAPLNTVGDKHGTPLKDGVVTMPPGWKEAYTAWAAAGWNGLAAPAEWGGQELPHALNAACIEMWNSASMAFGIGPVLTMGAVEALAVHGADELKQNYLAKLVSGEWMGTMKLTEPQAGSDVGALRTRPSAPATAPTASPARRSSSPTASTISPTTSSISCWRACPTRRPARAASRCSWCRSSSSTTTARSARATTCAAIRSSTSSASTARRPAPWSMATQGGAVGWLVGEENRGLACMFTMMNNARLAVGLQGVGDRRAGDAAGARLCARAPPGPRGGRAKRHEPDHRASRRAGACC